MKSILNTVLCGGATVAIAISMAPVLTSCSTPSSKPFATDSVSIERSWTMNKAMEDDDLDGRSTYSAVVDYPTNDNAGDLNDSVRLWMSNQLLPASSEPVLTKRVLEEAANVFFGENDGNEWGAERTISIRKIFEDKKYVTFEVCNYIYSGGAAHGMYSAVGTTFVKSNGSRVTWQNINKTDDLRKMITEKVAASREVTTDQLKGEVIIDESECKLADGTFALPFPQNSPWLVDSGWNFSYDLYEIMCYADGIPAGVVGKDSVKLTQE